MASAKPVPNPFDDLIDNLEASYKALVSNYCSDFIENRTNHENAKKTSLATSESNKIAYEQNFNNLLEKARNLEMLLIKTRLEISKKSPEAVLKEEIELLNAESNRKDELVNDTKKKLEFWERHLVNLENDIENRVRQHVEHGSGSSGGGGGWGGMV